MLEYDFFTYLLIYLLEDFCILYSNSELQAIAAVVTRLGGCYMYAECCRCCYCVPYWPTNAI